MSHGNGAQHSLLDAAAQQLSQWGLSAPAIFFLELHRPFAFVASQLALFLQPLLGFFIRDDDVLRLSQWLAHEDSFDELISRLEAGDHA